MQLASCAQTHGKQDQIVKDAELGKRLIDKLVQVATHDGGEHWVYVHIEVQGGQEGDFAERLFTYNYRLYDKYRRPIASLAVLADDRPHWKPQTQVPKDLQNQLWQDIEQLERNRTMPYITSVERIGIEKGMQQGMQQGMRQGESALLERQLTRRFGPPSAETRARLQAATVEQLEQWAENILDATTLEEVFKDH